MLVHVSEPSSDLYEMCVCNKSPYFRIQDFVVSPVSRHFPYSRDFVVSNVSGHFPYSRDFVVSPGSRHFQGILSFLLFLDTLCIKSF